MMRRYIRWTPLVAIALVLAVATPAAWAQDTDPGQPVQTATADEDPAPEPEPEPEPADPEPTPDPGADEPGALSQTADAVREGGAQVTEQGQKIWTEILLPMGQRIAAALPGVVKALALLILFWIGAVALAALVKRLLHMTELDNRLAADLGLGSMLEGEEGKVRSIEDLAATTVKWIVLAFGFLAFFNALNLTMVAGPLQSVLDKITSVVPAVLTALLILALYWVVGTLLKLGATKGLSAMGFDQRVERYLKPREVKGELIGPSAMIGRLIFYIVLLFGIPPFLDALGQEALVVPLRDMLGKVLAFLPNIIGALILLFIGRIIATIVREVVTNFLAATGVDRFAERFGFGQGEDSKSLSEIVGAIAYFFIIIPIIVAAVDSLQVQAISDPVKNTLEELLAAIPLIFVALVVVAIGYFIAKAVKGIVESFLQGVGFDSLPEKLGLDFLQPREGAASLSSIGGIVVMGIILLLTAEQALATLQLTQLSELVGSLIRYLPALLIGIVIILAALSLGTYVGNLVERLLTGSGQARLLGGVAKYAIVFLGVSMGLNQLGVAEDIINVAVAAVFGAAALALGLAFGLGGRDRAREFLDQQPGSSGGGESSPTDV